MRITGIDADKNILEIAKKRLKGFGDRINFYHGWAEDFLEAKRGTGEKPGIILMDLGVSLFHYEKGGRGFSFAKDEPLDMRIDTELGFSAAQLLASISEKELADLLFFNAEERYSRRIARSIIEARKTAAITSSAVLAEIVRQAVPPEARHRRVHAATKTYQALRIAVNGELVKLQQKLEAAFDVLNSGGRLGVITFHSLEDRIVKNFFRQKAPASAKKAERTYKQRSAVSDTPIYNSSGIKDTVCAANRIITKKPVGPAGFEIKENPASRSAKIRVIEKGL
ncbi:ribosomal RNA small subunit methyltransferase H [Spirochaetia bacterium]|nr:ribosomal RNA small subunit methyltransferase H [Spirochaetia bacterium]